MNDKCIWSKILDIISLVVINDILYQRLSPLVFWPFEVNKKWKMEYFLLFFFSQLTKKL